MNIASYNKSRELELEADTKLIKRYWKLQICRFGLLAGGGRFRVNPIITEMLRNTARSCQIHPRSGEIPSDPARFLENRDEITSSARSGVYYAKNLRI